MMVVKDVFLYMLYGLIILWIFMSFMLLTTTFFMLIEKDNQRD